MNAAGRYHLSKPLDAEFQQNLGDVLQITTHIKTSSLGCYEIIPGVTSHQELGKWLVEHGVLHLTLTTSTASFSRSFPAADERLEQAKEALDVEELAQARITTVKLSFLHPEGLFPPDAVTVEDGVRRTEFGLVRRLSQPFPPRPETGQSMM